MPTPKGQFEPIYSELYNYYVKAFKKTLRKFVLIFLALLLFSLIGLFAYVRFSDYLIYRKLSNIPSVDKWLTYSDLMLRLSFRYPPTWLVEKVSNFPGYPKDYYRLDIHSKDFPTRILIEYDIYLDPQTKNEYTKSIAVNDLKLYPVSNWSFYYLEGTAPVHFSVYSWYSTGDFYAKFLSDKEQQILNKILYSIKRYPSS